MLCLSEFYFLNRSSAKQSANSSAELTCDHDKDTLIEYKVIVTEFENKLGDLEERRAGLETQVANVQSLPRLVQDRARIEEMKEELHINLHMPPGAGHPLADPEVSPHNFRRCCPQFASSPAKLPPR